MLMVFKFFSSTKSAEKKFKKYVGKPVVTSDGKTIGAIVSIRLSKNDLRPVSITVRMSDGSLREFNVNDTGATFTADKVVLQKFNDEYSGFVSTLRNETTSIEERLRDIMDKLNKLSELLIKGEIKEDLYRDIRDRLEKERTKWIRQCNDKISAINDTLSEIDRKISDAEKRKGELMIKQVVGELGDDDKRELMGLDDLINRLRKVRSELLSLRMELEKECY